MRPDIVSKAREYVGVPYFHAGRDKNGVDCAGLILAVLHDLDLTQWDDVDYTVQVDTERLRNCIKRFCTYVASGPFSPEEHGGYLPPAGSLLLLGSVNAEHHLAIATGEGTMIHACNKMGKVVEHGYDRKWRRITSEVYIWRGDKDA